MNIDLTGRRAIVTGSTAGIGRSTAEGLARAGAAVVITGRTSQRVETAVRERGRQGLVRGDVPQQARPQHRCRSSSRPIRCSAPSSRDAAAPRRARDHPQDPMLVMLLHYL